MNFDYISLIEDSTVDDLKNNNKNTFDDYLNYSKECVTSTIKQHDDPFLNNGDYQKKIHKRDLECTVCGGRAFGYNFDRITCESCKAFFRRNALRNMMELKCRFGGNCSITVENRRHCTHCRIKKCFAIGMRKEWIRSEEEKNKKLDHFEKHRKNKLPKERLQVTIIKQPKSSCSQTALSVLDRTRLNNIYHCYEQYTGEPSRVDYVAPTQTLLLRLHDFFNRKKPVIINFISYFKHIAEIQQLHIDDQVLLIKQNIHMLLPVNYALLKTPAQSQFRYTHIQTVGCINNINLHSMYQSLSNIFVPYVSYDPLAIKLSLVCLFLSTKLVAVSNDTIEYKQHADIQRIQTSYTELLWLYMLEKYGQARAVKLYSEIIAKVMHLQIIINQIDSIIRLNDDTQYIDSLLKSVLQLT